MKAKDPLLKRRIALALVGMLLAGISVGIFKRAFFGVDPFQCFCNGWAQVIPIGFGTLYMLINAVLLVIDLFLDRHYIGISTFINLFLLGYVAEFTEGILASTLGETGLAVRLLLLVVGIVLTCIAAALYYTADLGVSTYDAIPLYLSDRKYKVFGHVLPFRVIRIGCDLLCVLIGFLLGWMPGIGTIITALFMGPLITFFRKRLSDPLLQKQPA
ncbi:MAG: hypothetical protein IK133_06925 [Clostridia bacterium]|nr:hypothetical protein [Clostridia bacterium]MBR5383540.1 hypothetical protein [Clostridia bacterium]